VVGPIYSGSFSSIVVAIPGLNQALLRLQTPASAIRPEPNNHSIAGQAFLDAPCAICYARFVQLGLLH